MGVGLNSRSDRDPERRSKGDGGGFEQSPRAQEKPRKGPGEAQARPKRGPDWPEAQKRPRKGPGEAQDKPRRSPRPRRSP